MLIRLMNKYGSWWEKNSDDLNPAYKQHVWEGLHDKSILKIISDMWFNKWFNNSGVHSLLSCGRCGDKGQRRLTRCYKRVPQWNRYLKHTDSHWHTLQDIKWAERKRDSRVHRETYNLRLTGPQTAEWLPGLSTLVSCLAWDFQLETNLDTHAHASTSSCFITL